MKTFLVAGTDDNPVAGIDAGTFAIFDSGASGTDFAPAINPKAYLSRIGLHSALDYIGVDRVLTGSTSRGAVNYSPPGQNTTVNLGAHGQSGKPLILAEWSANGSTWYTVNGTQYTALGPTLRGRSFHIQCDATNVYAYINEVGNIGAQTLYFRVHVLARTFSGTRPATNVAFKVVGGAGAYVEAAFGAFDTRRNYLQVPAAGQSADIQHRSGPTLLLDSIPGEINLGFSTGNASGNLALGDFWSPPAQSPLITNLTPQPLVFAGPGSVSDVIEFSPSAFRLSNANGDDIFNSARKMVAFVDEFKTTLNIPLRPKIVGDAPHEVIHFNQPVASGTNLIMGWLQLTGSSLNIINSRPIDFSGSVIITGGWFIPNGTTLLFVQRLSILFPRLSGGNLQIVENYFCFDESNGTPTTALPAYSVDVHMFACATTGGI